MSTTTDTTKGPYEFKTSGGPIPVASRQHTDADPGPLHRGADGRMHRQRVTLDAGPNGPIAEIEAADLTQARRLLWERDREIGELRARVATLESPIAKRLVDEMVRASEDGEASLHIANTQATIAINSAADAMTRADQAEANLATAIENLRIENRRAEANRERAEKAEVELAGATQEARTQRERADLAEAALGLRTASLSNAVQRAQNAEVHREAAAAAEVEIRRLQMAEAEAMALVIAYAGRIETMTAEVSRLTERNRALERAIDRVRRKYEDNESWETVGLAAAGVIDDLDAAPTEAPTRADVAR